MQAFGELFEPIYCRRIHNREAGGEYLSINDCLRRDKERKGKKSDSKAKHGETEKADEKVAVAGSSP